MCPNWAQVERCDWMFKASGSRKFQQYSPSRFTDIFNLKDYVVLDVETTGLSQKADKITEIALVKVIDGEQAGQFTSLVNPEKSLSSRIVSLTGLTDDMLKDAPIFSDIAGKVKQFIGSSIILAHNAVFDLGFLSGALTTCGIKHSFRYLDTVRIAKMAYPGLENYKLETLISELNLAEKQSHRAMDDVQCTVKLYQLASERLGNPLISALISCCSPIEDYQLSYKCDPLKGLRFALLGKFTFPHSAAKKLITAAGGTVVDLSSSNIDYLVYGFIEPTDDPFGYEALVDDAIRYGKKHEKPSLINEVHLLGLCGATFYDDAQASKDSDQ